MLFPEELGCAVVDVRVLPMKGSRTLGDLSQGSEVLRVGWGLFCGVLGMGVIWGLVDGVVGLCSPVRAMLSSFGVGGAFTCLPPQPDSPHWSSRLGG